MNEPVAQPDRTQRRSNTAARVRPKTQIPPRASLQEKPTSKRDALLAWTTAGLLTGAIVTLSTAAGLYTLERPVPTQDQYAVYHEPAPAKPTGPNPYESLALSGSAYVVYDVHRDRILVAHNETEQLPLASLTKIMTSFVALETAQADQRFAISSHAINTEGDSGLFANETWRLKDLVSFTMLTSSNDGAYAIATAVGSLLSSTPETINDYDSSKLFVGRMNVRADELGLHDLTFYNATGLDLSGGRAGAEGSASDVARLLAHVWEHTPHALRDTTTYERTFISEDGFVHLAENTNEYAYTTPGILGSKTGYTDLAGGNLAVMYNSGLDHPMVVVVLGSTKEGRFEDVNNLVDATYLYIEAGWYAYEVAGSSELSI